MTKVYRVREYDYITANSNYQATAGYQYIPPELFSELVKFIRNIADNAENADILDFVSVQHKRQVGDVVTIRNYVGLLQLPKGYQIEILPKIDFSNPNQCGDSHTKRVFLRMLKSLKDFPSKVFQESALDADRMTLYELFISLYLQEVRQLVKHGIKSDYLQQEGNLPFFKGKLQMRQHIKVNLSHKERFFVAYDEFVTSCPENRLIKATLLKLQKQTSSAENSKEIRQLLTAFETVESSVHYHKDFVQVKAGRMMKDYKIPLEWAKVFLINQSFTTFSGHNHSRALLFPMEEVFESYVAQNVNKVMGLSGWSVETQHTGKYLFYKPKRSSLRPDIFLKNSTQSVIMDTKWKRLIDNERKNYGISQADMYQMYAYSKKYEVSDIWLLYPLTCEMREHSDICFNSNDNTTVHVFFVDVENIENSLQTLCNQL